MFARITLLLFVGLLGFDLGAGVYEMRNVLPMEQSQLVAGKVATVTAAAGPRFWIVVTPLLAGVTILALIGTRTAPPAQVPWRILATAGELLIIATTFLYFVPTIRHIADPSVTPYAADVLPAKLQQWMALNWFRAIGTTVTFVAGLIALTKW
jgi:hypothetical protein